MIQRDFSILYEGGVIWYRCRMCDSAFVYGIEYCFPEEAAFMLLRHTATHDRPAS